MGVAHWYDERERGDIYTNTDTNMTVTMKIYNSCKAILNTVYQIETIYQSTQDSQTSCLLWLFNCKMINYNKFRM